MKKAALVKGTATRIERRLPTECGTDLKGAKARIIETYQSERKGGEEHAIVQLEETGAVVGVPTSSLRGVRRSRTMSIGAAAWERVFGGKKRKA
jgi:hypothetical protein